MAGCISRDMAHSCSCPSLIHERRQSIHCCRVCIVLEDVTSHAMVCFNEGNKDALSSMLMRHRPHHTVSLTVRTYRMPNIPLHAYTVGTCTSPWMDNVTAPVRDKKTRCVIGGTHHQTDVTFADKRPELQNSRLYCTWTIEVDHGRWFAHHQTSMLLLPYQCR
jgi:hypothetical protein